MNCRPSVFKFASTADIDNLPGIIGQERALRSVNFGLSVDSNAYNLFLSGYSGTGKKSLAKSALYEKAREKPVPSDCCYVFNFEEPECPALLTLPAGKGKELQKDLKLCVEKMLVRVLKAFEEDKYDEKKSRLLNKFSQQSSLMFLELENKAREQGFTVTNSNGAISTIPLQEGEVLSQESYMNMSDAERHKLRERGLDIQEIINKTLRHHEEMERVLQLNMKNLEQETIREVIVPFFAKLFEKYRNYEQVVYYLEGIHRDLLSNADLLLSQGEKAPMNMFVGYSRRHFLRRYHVNVLVDNSKLTHAPVIFEDNPTYSNLFGHIEYEGEFGILATDFSKIKAGSIHRANGGYLVLNVLDALKIPYVWDTLKRALKNKQLTIDNLSNLLSIGSSNALQLSPAPTDTKVVLIGEPVYYYLLYENDEEFSKLFRLRADFDLVMDRNQKNIKAYAHLISSQCRQNKWLHFTPEAVAAIVDYGSRLADDQGKLSTQFNKIGEILQEAHSWAEADNSPLVGGEHVGRALSENRYRASLYNEKVAAAILEEKLIINTEGFKVGEINGLAVYQTGSYSFGKPVRITAKTFMGEKGLVNIEREIQLSGRIHSKGILTLSGYLGFKYAQHKPLALSASLTFEQSYGGIEGDSASSAELYALLSSLADIPIRQGIAVTGSVNQNGEIQAVGGINEKIEGFFSICKERGLDGSQGVIIPQSNTDNLMLDGEVALAVKQKKFFIWAVKYIDEGIEILTGTEAGEADEKGRYPRGSVHYRVNRRLEEWNLLRRNNGKSTSRTIRR
jgi:lon-related putative ATP-dependent protease